MSQDQIVDPDDRRARAAEVAAEYWSRVADGTAEPREELLARHVELRDLLQGILEQSRAVTESLPFARPEPVSLPETLQQEILAAYTGSSPDRTGRIEELCRRHAQHAGEIRGFVESLKGAEDRIAVAMHKQVPPPKDIGPYRILGVLGEGGMGTVYVAEQREPVRRRVALKVIKLGMDSKVVLLRFEAERQALAMMEHDNIAKVFDTGTTDLGQPYFAMELVPGQPITEYCDRQRLGTRARLRLFQQVCAGVQHAHQKGVIHRDLKPSNILVTAKQGGPVPKIIDFGVAKATGHRLTEATIFTAQGSVLGTPEYMSPEQVELSSADIDTRSDIYSLGVILYELLVGELPFPRANLRRAGLLEIQRKIREDEPPTPSTRLTSLGEASQGAAQRRRTNVSSLVRDLRGDLDWITMRALEKERSRRYSTAQSLSEDIDRHLSHEPVMAGPPGAAYRMRKFVRRYRLQVISVVLIFLALVAGTIGTAVGLTRASELARLALAERDHVDAEVQYMLFDLREKLRPIGRLDLLEDVAHRAKEYYESRSVVDLGYGERRNLALAWLSIGEVFSSQGHADDALAAFSAAAKIQDALLGEALDNALVRADSARIHMSLGRLREDRGDLDGALTHYLQSRSIMSEVALTDPSRVVWQVQLAFACSAVGNVLSEQGNLSGALESLRSALDIQRRLVAADADDATSLAELARVLSSIGFLLVRSGDLGGAVASHDEALKIRKRLVDADPTNADRLRDLAKSYTFVATALSERGDVAGELANVREATDIMTRLVELDPTNAMWKEELARDHNQVGSALRREGDPAGALENFEESIRLREELAARDAGNTDWKSGLSETIANLGNAQRDLGDLNSALASYRRAAELSEELVGRDPANAIWQNDLARIENGTGIVLRRMGDRDGAIESYRRAQEIRQALVDLDPANAAWKSDLAGTDYNLGNVLRSRGDLDEALESYEKSKAILEMLVAQDPTNIARRRQLANVYNNITGVLFNRGESAAGLAQLRITLALYEELAAEAPTNATLRRDLARTHVNLGQVLADNASYSESVEAFEQAFEEPSIRNDLRQNFLYHAACAAALAAGVEDQDAARFQARALSWLAEDLRLRSARIAELERQIEAAPRDSDSVLALQGELERHRQRIELARTGDPDLEGLRGLPVFETLFEGR